VRNSEGVTSRNASAYSSNFDRFRSLFDAAAYGHYLGGINPQNTQGNTIGYINEQSLYNASRFAFEWRLDSRSRFVPFALLGNNETMRINNLHIHSKATHLFFSLRQPFTAIDCLFPDASFSEAQQQIQRQLHRHECARFNYQSPFWSLYMSR